MARLDWNAGAYVLGTEPTDWHLDLAGLRIMVHRNRLLDGGFVSCHAMGVVDVALAAESIESARNEALIVLRGRAKRWHEKLAAAVEEIGKP